jgi:hypothetical protein
MDAGAEVPSSEAAQEPKGKEIAKGATVDGDHELWERRSFKIF